LLLRISHIILCATKRSEILIIEKKQTRFDQFSLNWTFFKSGREGLDFILKREKNRRKHILLPSYIGFSTREGSGVFDPVRKSGIDFSFYNMDSRLQVDLGDIEQKIDEHPGSLLLLIHYFGFKDNQLEMIKKMAKTNGLAIIEDYAHAFFTFLKNPEIDFDYGIFSIHKLLPYKDGGALLSKSPLEFSNGIFYDLFRFDLAAIAHKRRENFCFILEKLKQEKGLPLEPLHQSIGSMTPQTFPLLVDNEKLRDALYFAMNEEGYGLVSLYHELIEEIDKLSFKDAYRISKRIINLPVHQDASAAQLNGMMEKLFFLI
jgi:dTDP-4-amino-4,6-dideoxygalactose transaminase